MLVYRLLNPRAVTEFVNGVLVNSGVAATGTSGTATITDVTAAAFADVALGDIVNIKGDAQDYTVSAATDDNNIDVTPNLAATYAGDRWVIHRGGRPFSDFDLLQAVKGGTEFAALYDEGF